MPRRLDVLGEEELKREQLQAVGRHLVRTGWRALGNDNYPKLEERQIGTSFEALSINNNPEILFHGKEEGRYEVICPSSRYRRLVSISKVTFDEGQTKFLI